MVVYPSLLLSGVLGIGWGSSLQELKASGTLSEDKFNVYINVVEMRAALCTHRAIRECLLVLRITSVSNVLTSVVYFRKQEGTVCCVLLVIEENQAGGHFSLRSCLPCSSQVEECVCDISEQEPSNVCVLPKQKCLQYI